MPKLKRAASQGATYLQVDSLPEPLSGVCDIGGHRYFYKAADLNAVLIVPCDIGVGLKAAVPAGTELVVVQGAPARSRGYL